jgi:hypothetical protein
MGHGAILPMPFGVHEKRLRALRVSAATNRYFGKVTIVE